MRFEFTKPIAPQVFAAHRAGMPQKEIASRIGVTQQHVSRILRRSGIRKGKRRKGVK